MGDRDGNKAKSTFYVPWGTSMADAWTMAYELANRVSSLSNGVLVRIELVYKYRPDAVPAAPDGSTNERKLLLLITNDVGEIYGLVVPSPGDIFELAGAYTGIRVDLNNSVVIAFGEMLAAVELRTDDNRPVGTEITTGGLAL